MQTPIDFSTLTSAQKDALIVQLLEQVNALTRQVQELQAQLELNSRKVASHRQVTATTSPNRKVPVPRVASLQGVNRATPGRR